MFRLILAKHPEFAPLLHSLVMRASTSAVRRYQCIIHKRAFCSGNSVTDPTPPASDQQPLAGTVPTHRLYAFLHTLQPPSAYPAKFTTPVHRKLLLATAPWGGAVNFAWESPLHPQSHFEEAQSETQTNYRLTAFSSARGKLEIDAVSLANVDDVGEALRAHAEPLASTYTQPETSPSDDIHLYVCTHGARDCRCGDIGGAVVRAIRDELDKRRQRRATDPSTRIKLAEVAHVGGHQYAANVLVYPHGEWLGRVLPQHVPGMLDTILARPARPMHAKEMPICPSHWRGRMGLSKEEQTEFFSRFSNIH